MGNYFCGWYYRCQSQKQTLAVIPSVHRTETDKFCTIQLMTDTNAYSVQLPISEFRNEGDLIRIGSSSFSPEGIRLDIHTDDWNAFGSLRFGPFTPARYDIMGPFHFVPFMQCRHSVYSLHHHVNGELNVNGSACHFDNGLGYMEGDRGRSFPSEYLWTQCSFPQGAVMLSVADIPIGSFHFTGIIGVVFLHGKEHRLATYLGAKAAKISPGEIVIRQGKAVLTVSPQTVGGHLLLAPKNGAMGRTIREQLACPVRYRFKKDGVTLLELDAPNAALEYEY